MDIRAIQLVAQTLGASGQASPPAAADVVQAERFRALLEPATAGTPVSAGAAPDVPIVPTEVSPAVTETQPAVSKPTTLGDAILEGLGKVRSGLRDNWQSVADVVDPNIAPLTTSGMLQFQLKMLDLGFQYQMLAGAVTKTAQNVDQLVKMQ